MVKRNGYQSITKRFWAKDWKKTRKVFPAFRDESACSYFNRLANKLQEEKNED